MVGSSTGILGSFDASSTDGSWSQYYGAGLKYYQNYIYKGSTVKLAWHVTNSSGAAAANAHVTLVVNKGYSGSTASWVAATGSAGPVSNSTAGDGLHIPGVTDGSGNISFIVQDNSSTGEPSSTPTNAADPLVAPITFGQFTLLLDSADQSSTALDIVDFHVLALPSLPAASGATPSAAPAFTAPSSPADATALVGGAAQSTAVTPNSGAGTVHVTVGSTGISVTAAGTSESGATNGLLPDNSLQVAPTGSTNITAAGFGVSTMVDVYVHTTLTYLGRFPTDSSGNLTASFRIPDSIDLGQHTLQLVGLTTSGSTVSIAIPVTVVTSSSQATADAAAAAEAALVAAKLAAKGPAVKASADARASITASTSDKLITCSAPSVTGSPTMAAYYLFINHKLVSGKRVGTFTTTPLYPAIDASTGDATLAQATWAISPTWNAGHISTASCAVQIGNAAATISRTSPSVTIARVGKLVKSSNKATAPAAVTMRLVTPVMTKDAGGKAVDFVDESSSPVKDHWSQYYGNANGGLGVFYKYFTAGSTMTLKYHVTDSKTGTALPYFNVWLVANKNYGGVETASFSYQKNGLTYSIAGHTGDLGETQIPGITDVNGDVTFTLVNTNTATTSEPAPAALNGVQPTSVSPVFSTITLMAHLVAGSETTETKDFIWAHIVQP